MIFFEHNMNVRDSYVIADTQNFTDIKILDKRSLLNTITHIGADELIDDRNAKLYNKEICHINNLFFKSDKEDGTVIILDSEKDLNRHVSIIPDGPSYRVICFNNLELIGDKHFSILYHKESYFEHIIDCFTIFVDKKFGTSGDRYEMGKEIIDLIGTLADAVVTCGSGIEYNQFYNTPKMLVGVDMKVSAEYAHNILSPIQVIRLDYTANDIYYILKYMLSIISIFDDIGLSSDEIKDFYKDKGIFAEPFSNNLKIIDILCDVYDDSFEQYIDAANVLRETVYEVQDNL